MPRDEKRAAELLRRAADRLKEPGMVIRIVRQLRLSAMCGQLPADRLAALVRVCEDGDEQALRSVLAAIPDPLMRHALLDCLTSTEGRVEVREAVQLEQWGREHEEGSDG